MIPKRMMVAIFKGTQTLENIEANPHFVLQLLNSEQYNLVNLLGKQSGKKIDKIQRLQKRNLLMDWNGFHILREALAVMEMKVQTTLDAGDHIMFLCEVVAYRNLHAGAALTTCVLNERGIIRI
jgi:flavin reductase (DIM6/NTAB) family NADH-FMN oxidoreductase RutF